MCGFAGFLSRRAEVQPAASCDIVRQMCDTLAHRGPQDSGIWVCEKIALGHRRLAILDLSAAGHQPMLSACGRYVIAFNGEIYNHQEVRGRLERERAGVIAPDAQMNQPPWRGHSDTETLLMAVSNWGVETTLDRRVAHDVLVGARGRGKSADP